jgi:hypothetical protein
MVPEAVVGIGEMKLLIDDISRPRKRKNEHDSRTFCRGYAPIWTRRLAKPYGTSSCRRFRRATDSIQGSGRCARPS